MPMNPGVPDASIQEGLARLRSELASEGVDLDPAARRTFRAPGRVNLMGDHTDYNGGLVLPAAIDLAVYLACVPSDAVFLQSHTEPGTVALTADGAAVLDGHTLPPWGSYPRGVLAELGLEGRPPAGLSGVIVSDIPPGRGLASSAALEVAVATAALSIAEFELDAWTTAEACRRAEQEFAGVECGVMDQATALLGREGFACLIDTALRTLRYVPIPESIEIVVVDSGVRRNLSGGEYNRRRRECLAALDLLRSAKQFRGLAHLSDLRPDDLEYCNEVIPTGLGKRVRHVVTENARVRRVSEILQDLAAAGGGRPAPRLRGELSSAIEESHTSLVVDYEAGHPLTDRIVELAADQAGYIGARQTGAGWGGSVVVFCEKGSGAHLAESALEALASSKWAPEMDLSGRAPPSYHVCEISGGSSEIDSPNPFRGRGGAIDDGSRKNRIY